MSSSASELFRRNLQTVMHETGVSHAALAEAVGTSRPGITRIISGVDGVTIERADRIANALGMTLSELLEEKLRIPVKSG